MCWCLTQVFFYHLNPWWGKLVPYRNNKQKILWPIRHVRDSGFSGQWPQQYFDLDIFFFTRETSHSRQQTVKTAHWIFWWLHGWTERAEQDNESLCLKWLRRDTTQPQRMAKQLQRHTKPLQGNAKQPQRDTKLQHHCFILCLSQSGGALLDGWDAFYLSVPRGQLSYHQSVGGCDRHC